MWHVLQSTVLRTMPPRGARHGLLTRAATPRLQVIPMPLPNASPKALVECFWQAQGRIMRYETQCHILRLLVGHSWKPASYL